MQMAPCTFSLLPVLSALGFAFFDPRAFHAHHAARLRSSRSTVRGGSHSASPPHRDADALADVELGGERVPGGVRHVSIRREAFEYPWCARNGRNRPYRRTRSDSGWSIDIRAEPFQNHPCLQPHPRRRGAPSGPDMQPVGADRGPAGRTQVCGPIMLSNRGAPKVPTAFGSTPRFSPLPLLARGF